MVVYFSTLTLNLSIFAAVDAIEKMLGVRVAAGSAETVVTDDAQAHVLVMLLGFEKNHEQRPGGTEGDQQRQGSESQRPRHQTEIIEAVQQDQPRQR